MNPRSFDTSTLNSGELELSEPLGGVDVVSPVGDQPFDAAEPHPVRAGRQQRHGTTLAGVGLVVDDEVADVGPALERSNCVPISAG